MGLLNLMHQSTSLTEYAAKQLSSAFELASKTSGVHTDHDKQKQRYDKKAHGDSYVVGDLVWLLNPKIQ